MDAETSLIEQIREAVLSGTARHICGGNSKRTWLNLPSDVVPINTTAHSGIVEYEPSELVLTVRGGTPLTEVFEAAGQHQQYFAFEPPVLSERSTIGGVVASGLSGPNRPWGGSVRDSLLGVRLINGKGEVLQFGGKVFKNVAGFDLFRIQAGSWGRFGILSEVSLRLHPAPHRQAFKSLPMSVQKAHHLMLEWQKKPYPLSGLIWHDGMLHLRLFGSNASIARCLKDINLPFNDENSQWWYDVRDLKLECFNDDTRPLYACYAASASSIENSGDCVLLDWGGCLRWMQAREGGMAALQLLKSRHDLVLPCKTAPPEEVDSKKMNLLYSSVKKVFDPNSAFC